MKVLFQPFNSPTAGIMDYLGQPENGKRKGLRGKHWTRAATVALVLCALSITVFAEDGAAPTLSPMWSILKEWLDAARLRIAPVLITLAYARAGLMFVSSVFLGGGRSGKATLDSAKRWCFYSTIAFLLLLVFPAAASMAIHMFKPMAWAPGK